MKLSDFLKLEAAAIELGSVDRIYQLGADGELAVYALSEWGKPVSLVHTTDGFFPRLKKECLAELYIGNVNRPALFDNYEPSRIEEVLDLSTKAGNFIRKKNLINGYGYYLRLEDCVLAISRQDVMLLQEKEQRPKTVTSVNIEKSDALNEENNSFKWKRTRKDKMTLALESAVKSFGKEKPSFEEVWNYFQNDKDETNIIVDFKESGICWEDARGNNHWIRKTSLANRLSRLKS